MDETLKALLRYVKQEHCDATWTGLRAHVFGALYHAEMGYVDVLSVLLRAYTKALIEPRFELPGRHNAAEDLILAPIKGLHSIEALGPKTLDSQYSVVQFYGAMITKMLSDLRATRVDWCSEEIWPERSVGVNAVPALGV